MEEKADLVPRIIDVHVHHGCSQVVDHTGDEFTALDVGIIGAGRRERGTKQKRRGVSCARKRVTSDFVIRHIMSLPCIKMQPSLHLCLFLLLPLTDSFETL
jgi:hypothetical protein